MYETLPRLGVPFCSALRQCGFCVSHLLPSFAGEAGDRALRIWKKASSLSHPAEGDMRIKPLRAKHRYLKPYGRRGVWGLTQMGSGQEQWRTRRKPPKEAPQGSPTRAMVIVWEHVGTCQAGLEVQTWGPSWWPSNRDTALPTQGA